MPGEVHGLQLRTVFERNDVRIPQQPVAAVTFSVEDRHVGPQRILSDAHDPDKLCIGEFREQRFHLDVLKAERGNVHPCRVQEAAHGLRQFLDVAKIHRREIESFIRASELPLREIDRPVEAELRIFLPQRRLFGR